MSPKNRLSASPGKIWSIRGENLEISWERAYLKQDKMSNSSGVKSISESWTESLRNEKEPLKWYRDSSAQVVRVSTPTAGVDWVYGGPTGEALLVGTTPHRKQATLCRGECRSTLILRKHSIAHLLYAGERRKERTAGRAGGARQGCCYVARVGLTIDRATRRAAALRRRKS